MQTGYFIHRQASMRYPHAGGICRQDTVDTDKLAGGIHRLEEYADRILWTQIGQQAVSTGGRDMQTGYCRHRQASRQYPQAGGICRQDTVAKDRPACGIHRLAGYADRIM
jgi:hypothetical protein